MSTWLGKAIRFVSDTAVGLTDSSLSRVGLGSVIPDSAYSSTKSADAWSQVQNLGNTASNSVLNTVVPGAGTVTGALQTFNPTAKTTAPAVSPVPTASPAPLLNAPVTPAAVKEDYTDYYIVGGVLLALVVLIIIFLKR